MKNGNDVQLTMEGVQSSAAIDVLYELGLPHQAVDPEIRGINTSMEASGPVFCIRGVELSGNDKSKKSSKIGFDLFRNMFEGCVAVVETGGSRGAVIGENMGLSALAKGCKGFISDGGVRDTKEFAEMEGFSMFARFTAPISVKGRWQFTDYNVPISLPGFTCDRVEVNPGDYIVADCDGIAVIPKKYAALVIEAAKDLEEVEAKMQKALLAGMDREEVYSSHDRFFRLDKLVDQYLL